MTRTALTSLGPLCWIVTGIGLLAAGCTDEALDRKDDVPMGCVPVETTFALERADISAAVAQEIDLDGNGKPDDALGQAHDLVAGFAPAFDMTERFRARLATDVAWSLTIAECDGGVRVTFPRPDNALPHFHSAVGTITASGHLFADDGNGRVPLLALADATGTTGDDPGWRTGDALTFQAVRTGDELDGVFALALPTRVVKADLAAPIARFLDSQPADETMRAMADANRDGVVTAEEVAATTTYQGMTQADLALTIDGEPQTSIAFRFHATAMR